DGEKDSSLLGEDAGGGTDSGSTSGESQQSEPDAGEATMVELEDELDSPDEELLLEEANDVALEMDEDEVWEDDGDEEDGDDDE
ncbi:hypothetical protein FRC00_007301, partial [Tulasnella sp. 408]